MIANTGEDISIPEPRINHSQVTVNTSIVIYGGVDKDGVCFNDIWIYDLVSNYWKKVEINGEIPKARQGHSALLVDGDQILFFGGKIANIFEVNEIWKFDLSTNRFTLVQGTLLQREGFNRQIKPRIISEETTNHNPYQTFYKLKKIYMKTEGDNQFIKKEANNNEKQNPFEDIIINQEDANYINNLAEANKNLKFERFKYGDVPLPRDGHSTFMYEGKMFMDGA